MENLEVAQGWTQKSLTHRESTGVAQILSWAIILSTTFALFLFSFLIPKTSWDTLGHLASLLSLDIGDNVQLHQTVYAYAKDAFSAADYNDLVSGAVERENWATDPEAFAQLLPFYQPRVLLVWSAYLLYKVGVDPIAALHLISSLCVAISVFLLYLTTRRWLSLPLLTLVPLMCLLSGALDVARIGASDAVVFLLLSLYTWLVVNHRRSALLALMLLPAARSDMILLSLCLVPVTLLYLRHTVILTGLAALSAFIVYFAVNGYYGNYGWSVQFYNVNVEYLLYPAVADVQITVQMYVDAALAGLKLIPYNTEFQFFLFNSAILLIFMFRRISRAKVLSSEITRFVLIALSCSIFVLVHYLAFPLLLNRYFSSQYLLVGFALLVLLNQSLLFSNSHRQS